MARMDVDSRRRNAAGKLIGTHNGDPERWYKPMAHSHRSHSDGPPPTYKPGRKRTRRTLGATVKHQAQPPAQPPAAKHSVDVLVLTLYGLGDIIVHAYSAATVLYALRHPDARRAGGVSIHGWIDGVQYSGAMSLCFLHKLLS